MVNYTAVELNTTFGALSDPTRRAIIQQLSTGEATIGKLASPFNISLPAVSKHIRVLENAGLLIRRKVGRVHYCRLGLDPLKDAADWLENYRQFWEGQLDALADFLETDNEEKGEINGSNHN